ncbi:MAG TPA: hypothetical protein VH951_05085, partial [Dehalococcoidia bacterium]
MDAREARDFAALAGALGVQTAYRDATGRWRRASRQAAHSVVSALLRAEVKDPAAAMMHLRAQSERVLEPVVVAWLGRSTSVSLNLGPSRASIVACALQREDGSSIEW